MDELIAFIKARLGEDEAGANEVHRPRDCGCVDRDGDFDPNPIYCGCHYPARVLRDVAAKRKLIEEVTSRSTRDVAEIYLATLAAAWSDHPGYRHEWAP